jgi:hypothetical protein
MDKQEQRALRKARAWTRQIPECVGVGLGEKITRGKRTGRRAVVVLVDEKKPLNAVLGRFVPRSVGGVETDVVDTGGPFHALGLADMIIPQAGATYGRRFDRPVPCGVSLGHYRITAGTLGALGHCRRTGKRVVLTNYHVASPWGKTTHDGGYAGGGDRILQPGPADGGRRQGDEIGRLLSYQPIRFGDAGDSGLAAIWAWFRRLFRRPGPPAGNTGDLALVEVSAGMVVAEYPPDEGMSPPTGHIDARPGDEVFKIGRTTGFRRGECVYTNMRVTVDYGAAGAAVHEDQDVFTDISLGGDSGSMIVNGPAGLATALLYGGSRRFTIGMPWRYVAPRFRLEGESG